MHVRDNVRETGDALYLPARDANEPEYNRLQYLKVRSRKWLLLLSDFQLPAYSPHILGAEVFGEVEACAEGWRWTFAPAGVAVQGTTFQHEEDARADLAGIQKELFSSMAREASAGGSSGAVATFSLTAPTREGAS